ncbi:hypothetical protein Sarmat_00345 [Rickettsiales endosymbiont of Paramecium tredecaurelia]|uniref:hypothetical protein n=1 Tax=Candidatus Sarmatiella mevalonica TaxID=2770581 RepID=UPI001921689A|nr:hypothetical protein [Candidatus Sarmatiella mevalonica]MBL3284499.1 hypothetical protein [Candidatus Sarmatiella mevalonica]
MKNSGDSNNKDADGKPQDQEDDNKKQEKRYAPSFTREIGAFSGWFARGCESIFESVMELASNHPVAAITCAVIMVYLTLPIISSIITWGLGMYCTAKVTQWTCEEKPPRKLEIKMIKNIDHKIRTNTMQYEQNLEKRTREIEEIIKSKNAILANNETQIAAKDLASLSLTTNEIKKIDGGEKSIALLDAFANLAKNTSATPESLDKDLTNLESALKDALPRAKPETKWLGKVMKLVHKQGNQHQVIEEAIAKGKKTLTKSCIDGDLIKHAEKEIEFYQSLEKKLQAASIHHDALRIRTVRTQEALEYAKRQRESFKKHTEKQIPISSHQAQKIKVILGGVAPQASHPHNTGGSLNATSNTLWSRK